MVLPRLIGRCAVSEPLAEAEEVARIDHLPLRVLSQREAYARFVVGPLWQPGTRSSQYSNWPAADGIILIQDRKCAARNPLYDSRAGDNKRVER